MILIQIISHALDLATKVLLIALLVWGLYTVWNDPPRVLINLKLETSHEQAD